MIERLLRTAFAVTASLAMLHGVQIVAPQMFQSAVTQVLGQMPTAGPLNVGGLTTALQSGFASTFSQLP